MPTSPVRASSAAPELELRRLAPAIGAALLARPVIRRGIAALAPLVVGISLWPGRHSVDLAVSVLIFALVVVGAATTGDRAAGLIAALSSAAWLDFFLIPPYLTSF